MSTGFVYDTSFSDHTHQESPESAIRLENLFEYLRKEKFLIHLKELKLKQFRGISY